MKAKDLKKIINSIQDDRDITFFINESVVIDLASIDHRNFIEQYDENGDELKSPKMSNSATHIHFQGDV